MRPLKQQETGWPASSVRSDGDPARAHRAAAGARRDRRHRRGALGRGAPHELFRELRGECPLHWSEINEYPDEEGFWSVTRADDVREVSLDWETYSSERGGVTGLTHVDPARAADGQFIGMDPPKHDRLKTLFQRGFTPKRIAEHEDAIREITERVLDGVADRGELRPGQRRRAAGRLARDRQLHGDPRGGRRGLGDADELGARPRRRRPQPRRARRRSCSRTSPRSSSAAGDDRGAPREPDRRPDQRPRPRRDRRRTPRGARDRDGLLPARRRGQRLDQGDLHQRHARAAGAPRADADARRGPLADPGRGRGVPAHVPRLRPLPPHRHRGHRARRLPRRRGREGGHVVRLEQPRREPSTRTPTASTSSAIPTTRPSAPAAATSASGPHSPASS